LRRRRGSRQTLEYAAKTSKDLESRQRMKLTDGNQARKQYRKTKGGKGESKSGLAIWLTPEDRESEKKGYVGTLK